MTWKDEYKQYKYSINIGDKIATSDNPVWDMDHTGVPINETRIPGGYWHDEPYELNTNRRYSISVHGSVVQNSYYLVYLKRFKRFVSLWTESSGGNLYTIVSTSTDGLVWTHRYDFPLDSPMNAIIESNGILVVVLYGDSSNLNSVYVTTDGGFSFHQTLEPSFSRYNLKLGYLPNTKQFYFTTEKNAGLYELWISDATGDNWQLATCNPEHLGTYVSFTTGYNSVEWVFDTILKKTYYRDGMQDWVSPIDSMEYFKQSLSLVPVQNFVNMFDRIYAYNGRFSTSEGWVYTGFKYLGTNELGGRNGSYLDGFGSIHYVYPNVKFSEDGLNLTNYSSQYSSPSAFAIGDDYIIYSDYLGNNIYSDKITWQFY